MADNGTGVVVEQKQVAVFELAVRWIPANGRLDVVGSQVDDVTKLGMLEMAKAAILAQGKARAESPIVVPGRFAS